MLSFYLSMIDGDEPKDKFEKLYNTYKKQMVALATTILQNSEDAEDAVHDVFLSIAANMVIIEHIDDPTDIRNYLLVAVKNASLNKIRNHQASAFSAIEDISDYADISDEDFFHIVSLKAEYDEIVDAMLSMDAPYREIMYCHFVLEMSIKEAATLLNRNIYTAKKHLVRGKKILLSKLEKKGEK